nr:PREDICTED: ankyrin repeat domain-containing protein 61 isoform X2 [Latimeria chalumnae]|eukprot:XP_005998446.1 PREDICTED: ankyrin repeat domain-containing protein 61 isoform X2 [Latimeria chalumnae]
MCECKVQFNDLHAKLHESIVKGDTEIIKSLLQIHPVNEPITIWKNCGSLTALQTQGLAVAPLHLAATYRKEKSLRSILQLGADPEARDLKGRTALHLIIMHWPNIVVNWTEPKTKFQHAMDTMQSRTESCLRIICEHGAQVNAAVDGDNRQTPLHLTVRYGAYSAISILAEHGADINAMDGCGMTPLHMATAILSKEITEKLIAYGANVNSTIPTSGNTPLKLAIITASTKGGKVLAAELDCIHLLLKNGAEIDAQDTEGRAAIHDACFGGQEKIVDLLLNSDADVNLLTKLGESPLFSLLERRSNLHTIPLLNKLLSLAHPLRIRNNEGILPTGLLNPKCQQQKEFLLGLSKEPATLKDICRIQVRKMYGIKYKHILKKSLPKVLWDIVYSYKDYSQYLASRPRWNHFKLAIQNDISLGLNSINLVE